tara:strand:- start:91 stop:549 length:459 start_codon:yes stop_codon:yes gene_type:complete
MKKIAADRNYRIFKRAQVARETLAPMALRLAEKDGWTDVNVSEETGELLFMLHDDPNSTTSASDLVETYLERAKREYFKDEANKEAEKPLVYPSDVPLEGPWSPEDIERVARWNMKSNFSMCPSCGKSLAKWKEAVKADALRNGRIFIAANN